MTILVIPKITNTLCCNSNISNFGHTAQVALPFWSRSTFKLCCPHFLASLSPGYIISHVVIHVLVYQGNLIPAISRGIYHDILLAECQAVVPVYCDCGYTRPSNYIVYGGWYGGKIGNGPDWMPSYTPFIDLQPLRRNIYCICGPVKPPSVVSCGGDKLYSGDSVCYVVAV